MNNWKFSKEETKKRKENSFMKHNILHVLHMYGRYPDYFTTTGWRIYFSL